MSQYTREENGQYKAISYKINELLSQCSRQSGKSQRERLIDKMSQRSRQANQEKSVSTVEKPYENVKLVQTDDNTIRKLVEFSLNFKQHKRAGSKQIMKRDSMTNSPTSRKLRVKSAYDDVLSEVSIKNLNKEALMKFK